MVYAVLVVTYSSLTIYYEYKLSQYDQSTLFVPKDVISFAYSLAGICLAIITAGVAGLNYALKRKALLDLYQQLDDKFW